MIFYVLVFLNFMDFYTTSILIDSYGYSIEANLINYWLITTFDTVWVIFIFKAIALSLLWYGINNLNGKIITKKVMTWLLSTLVIGFSALVAGNLYLILGV